MNFSLVQRQSQTQKMKMSQTMKLNQSQIQSLNILSLGSDELREEIYKFAEKNPALEVEEKKFDFEKKEKNNFDGFSDYEKYSSVNSDSEMASDNFQKALESNQDNRENLHDFLLHQLNSLTLSKTENEFCTKLIQNLDKNGFHILAPESIFKGKNKSFFEKCIKIVQSFEPVGICCKDFRESLYFQAKNLSEEVFVPKSALFILNGHFDFLDPPQISKITKKVNRYLEAQKKLQYSNENQKLEELPEKFSEDEIEEALDFIKTLNPFPACNFSSQETNFVSPDVFVEKLSDSEKADLEDDEIPFRIRVANENLPKLKLSKSYEKFSEIMNKIPEKQKTEKQKSEANFSKTEIQKANEFIEEIEFRQSTVERVATEIVKIQRGFFEKGSRYLVPLRQKDVAKILNLDDSTISRMAKNKYLWCDWGVFDFGYFFTNVLNVETVQNQMINEFSGGEVAPVSKEGVKFEIAKILEDHKNDKKALSDQKISDILAEKGIKIARRTVAKYRGELNIDSSYSR